VRAVRSNKPGGPETLVIEDIAPLKPDRHQIVVSVKACGVNFPDVLMIEDKYQFRPPRPFSPGGEVSGLVAAVGKDIVDFEVGERVLGMHTHGGMAEEMLLDAGHVVKIPDAMPYAEAAAFLLTYGTSYYALVTCGEMRTGESMIVLGAAGGVGLAAVELGTLLGARVIAACSSDTKAQTAIAHGAVDAVVYSHEPLDAEAKKSLANQLKNAVGEDGADIVFDPIGGDYAEPAFRAIGWKGRFLVVGFATGVIPKLPLNLVLLKGAQVRGVFWGAWVARNHDLFRSSLHELMGFYCAGKIRPYVSETFPLERAGDAIRHLADRKAMGKVVVTIS
jgi:NADPH:quinone reductase